MKGANPRIHILSRYNGSQFVETQNWTTFGSCKYSVVFNPDNDNNQSDNIYLWLANYYHNSSLIYKFNNNTLQFNEYQTINITSHTNAYNVWEIAFLNVKNNNKYNNQKPYKNTNFMIANFGGNLTDQNPNPMSTTIIYDWFTMLNPLILNK